MRLMALLAQIFAVSTSVSASAEPLKELNISLSKSPFVLQLLVMRDKQLLQREFKDDGIKIHWHIFNSSPKAASAMAAGNLDIAGSMNTASVLMLNSEGLPVRIMTGTARPSSNFAIVAKPHSHLSIKDLRGRQIVGPKGTFLHQLLAVALEKEGMNEEDVQFINLSISRTLNSILSGNADAALLAGSALVKANKAGAQTIITAEGLVEPTLVMTTTQKFADEFPDIVRRVNKVYEEALLWVKNNPGEAAEMGAKEHGVSFEEAKTLMKRSRYFDKMTKKDVEDLRENQKFLRSKGMMRTEVQVDSLILPIAME